MLPEKIITHIKNSYVFESTPKRYNKYFYIGYHHKTSDLDLQVSKKIALKLLYKDLEEVESYSLIRAIKNSVDTNLYNVVVHFTFDYGTSVLKNSKFYYYAKENNKEKCIEELEKYKKFRGKSDIKNIKRRDFDIHLLKYNEYKSEDNKNGNKKRSSSKNVGFRF